MDETTRAGGAMALLVSLGLLLAAIGAGYWFYAPIADWPEATALITRVEEQATVKERPAYRKQVAPGIYQRTGRDRTVETVAYLFHLQFTLPDGAAIETHVGDATKLFLAEGETVTIRYNPEDPGEVVLASFIRIWGVALGLVVAAVFFFLVGLAARSSTVQRASVSTYGY
jgi:hypothetical protein